MNLYAYQAASSAPQFNYVRAAASSLDFIGRSKSLGYSHSQSYEMVAAYLGYASKAALDASLDPCAHNLHHIYPDESLLRQRIMQIAGQSAQYLISNIQMVMDTIRFQLSPVCVVSERRHPQNIPVGPVRYDDTSEIETWIHPSFVVHANNGYGFCRCCGYDVAYSLDDLDHQMLCSEHEGEFDLSPEEQDDWDSYAENIRNNY